jgi:cellulose synthase/poly-beta-1,6-N-acetylglucosamine synthase-like glycosyltransferase
MIPIVTQEEANFRTWPWIRQRSRWLKGYAVTWAVHMRDPVRLWRDLGPRRFWGFQIMFLGTVLQFALAPLLWSS